MCCKGEPVCVLMCKERESGTKKYVFDMDWNYRPDYMTKPLEDDDTIEKPVNFNRMKEYARALSRDFEFVRVDLYDAGEKVYFGELTFSPAGGRLEIFSDAAIREMYAKLKE